MAKSNTKLQPSLTPRLTTNGSADYCTLSIGQGTKVQTKNTPGCQLQNLNMLKNSYQTSMHNTCRNPVPSQSEFPTPTSSDTRTPFKKTSFPFHSTPFIPTSPDTHYPQQQNPCNSETLPFTPTSSDNSQSLKLTQLRIIPLTSTTPTLTLLYTKEIITSI
jgi:hypothetical protein